MTVLSCNFFSKALGAYVDVSVYIPSMHNGDVVFSGKSYEEIYAPRKFKTLYLLHGVMDDHSSWMRFTHVEEFAEQHEIALVMPSGMNSFYVNLKSGQKFYDFINIELPLWAEMNFPLVSGRENRFIAGLSMGGFGALRHGLSTPENYAAVGSFSGAIDMKNKIRAEKEHGFDLGLFSYENMFDDPMHMDGTENDMDYLAEQAKASGKPLPKMYLSAGTDDHECHGYAVAFRKHLEELGYDVTFMDMPGHHEWKVWEASVKEFIEMIAAM